MFPKISIIVPVYNAEEYLHRCLDSITKQTFGDWELILVNDGSLDRSGEICDGYALVDDRIKVIHKENGGVASAREIGVQSAVGDYSIHIDPDDWIDSDMLASLYDIAIKDASDIVICDFSLEYSKRHIEISRQECSRNDKLLYRFLSMELHGSLCNKLIRTELYRKYNIHFPIDIICWEDLYICCRLMMHTSKVSYIGKAFYHYDLYSNGNSMVRKATLKTLESMKLFCNYFANQREYVDEGWLYNCKVLTLFTSYRCDLLKEAELRKIYPEVHPEFIYKNKYNFQHPNYRGLALVLAGRSLKYSRLNATLNNIVLKIYLKLFKLK